MGRHAEGWKLVWRNGYGHVRFTHDKVRHFVSTGESDPARAREKAARIYAEVVSGKRRKVVAAIRAVQPLETLFAEWLASLEGVLDPETLKTYRNTYVPTHFVPFFGTFDAITDDSLYEYATARVKAVLRTTVRKEVSAMRGFMRWARAKHLVDRVPGTPELPQTSKGNRAAAPRKFPRQLSEAEVERAIMALPLLSQRIAKRAKGAPDRRLFAVRPRFVVMYETGLRPATLDLLRVPDHWRPGSNEIVIADDMDKARFGRTVGITAKARAALEWTVRELGITSGLIFGRHDYRTYTDAAGFHPYSLRHSRVTHLRRRGASTTGTMFVVGHTQATTTDDYTHGSREDADAALLVGGADLSGAIPDLDGSSDPGAKEGT